MEPHKRVVVNTLAQNIRSILNICLSLYSTRIVLDALGRSDFGIYSLVGGVVAMLGFITNAMVVSTQRHLSFSYGQHDTRYIHKVFANAVILHIILGLLLFVVLLCLKPLIFNTGILNIASNRIDEASVVYLIMISSLFVSVITAPYRALFIARENIIYISIIDVIDGVLKFALVFLLYDIAFDRLIAYALIMTGIACFNFFAFSIGSKLKYEESCIVPSFKEVDRSEIKRMGTFAGWTIYSTGCIIGRNQGMSVILNHFFGVVINSAYGIAMQVSSAVMFVAQSVMNAMNPQIVKAEGMGNRSQMLNRAESSCKYSFLLLSLVVIPIVSEMPYILDAWLKEVPEHAVMFCRFILIAALIDQLTMGLATANQAIGKIRNYSLIINSTKILTLPVVWICLSLGFQVEYAMWCYLCLEMLCALMRLPYLRFTAGLSVRHFVKNVFLRVSLPVLLMVTVCWGCTHFLEFRLRFMLTAVLSVIMGGLTIWFCGFTQDERCMMLNMIRKR